MELKVSNNTLFGTSKSGQKENKKQEFSPLFTKLDTNGDKQISIDELESGGYQGKDLDAMDWAIFSTERNVNKWFKLDRNYDGSEDNVEVAMWREHNEKNSFHLNGDMTPEEWGKQHDMTSDGDSYDNLKDWNNLGLNDPNPRGGIIVRFEKYSGRKITEDEKKMLEDVQKHQANKWLFKDRSLYERLNNDSYTRLATGDAAVSCCGGNIDLPPITDKPKKQGEEVTSCKKLFGPIAEDNKPYLTNSAEEVKNRLAWGMFETKSTENMSQAEYDDYKKEWEATRNMTETDFRNMLRPENESQKKGFEEKSAMTVQQIVDYIDIVEKITGKDFSSDD